MGLDMIPTLEITPIKAPPVALPPEAHFEKPLNNEDQTLFQEQWNTFNQLKNTVIFENPVEKNRNEKGFDLNQGTLFHGMFYDQKSLEKIKEIGIISGELIGIPEDGETYYCADFFRVPKNTNIADYLKWSKEIITTKSGVKFKRSESKYIPTPGDGSKKIGFIIDISNPKLEPLLKYDAYNPQANDRMKSIINNLPRELDPSPSRQTAAVLVGIPSNFISGVVIGEAITQEEIQKIKETMGKTTILYKTDGQKIE